MEDMGEVS